MSGNTINAKFVVEGEREYRQALNDINAGLKVNYAQMGLVSAQYGTAGKSQDALRAKSKALSETILSQRDKVALLETRLKASIDATGQGSKKSMEYQAALLKAQTALQKMENQQSEYTEALKETNSETTSLADVVNKVTDTLGIKVPPALQGVVDKLDGVSASGAALVGILGAAGTALAKLTISTAQTADDLLTLSSTSGMSTDALQEFAYMADLVDTSVDTITSSVTRMVNNMNAARTGSGEAAAAFARLNVRVTNARGELRDSTEVFAEVVDKLGRMKNETERDAVAMKILGESARSLNPLIEAGGQRLKELANQAHEVGYVMDSETLSRFGALQDQLDEMSKQSDALKNSLALALLPVLTGLFSVISDIPVPVMQTLIVLTATITSLLLVVKAIKDISGAVKGIKTLLSPANAAMLKTTAIILGVVAALIALGVIIAVISGRGKDLTNAMESVGTTVGSVQGRVASTQNTYPRNASGTRFWAGGRTMVGENGPEVVELPRGSRVYKTGSAPAPGGGYTDNSQYVFRVDDIETYSIIERRLKRERQSRRMGYVEV